MNIHNLKHSLALLILLTLSAGSGHAQQSFDAARLLADNRYLSSDELGGRFVGSAGSRMARAFIAARFAELGVQPFEAAYERPFSFTGRRDSVAYQGVNVIGFIPGTQHPDSFLVITAHYDHLRPKGDTIYNGADDNASGVGGLLAIAEFFAENPPRHSLLLAALDAEEMGLQGARALVNDPPAPRERFVLNVNMDMISRNENDELYAAGTHHYPQLRPALERAVDRTKIKVRFGHDSPDLKPGDDWTTSSDHAPFHAEKIPFVYFGVEDHPGYHQPTDDFVNIDPAFYIRAVDYIIQAIRALDGNLK